MKKILAFGGSTSSTSINKQLASFTASLISKVETEIIDFKDFYVPIYSMDEEGNGFPDSMAELSKLMKGFDGFVVSLAEHNGSYAAAFKNNLDWLSRIDRKIFNDKPVLLMAASSGGRGGASVLADAEAYFPHAGASDIISFSFPSFYQNFDNGQITNEELKNQLLNKIHIFKNKL